MSNLVFIDDLDDPYIHQISNILKNLTIDNKQDKVDPMYEPDEEFNKMVLSIDIGIVHLGVSVGFISKDYKLNEIAWVDLINITEFTHDRALDSDSCSLYHTRSIADWMEHLFHDHVQLFEDVDYILIERQPPQGIVAVEQLIYYRWRDKCHIISPRSMHKFFQIGNYDYEKRKRLTMHLAYHSCYWHPRATEMYNKFERKHDMSDSICLMLFWLNKRREKYLENKRNKRLKEIVLDTKGMTTNDWFEQFRHIPRVS